MISGGTGAQRPSGLRECRAAIVCGLLISLVILLAPHQVSFPRRDLWTEVRCLLATYPLGLLWVLVHVHKRAPVLRRRVIHWYVLAYVIRVLAACVLTSLAIIHTPEYGGHLSTDSWWHSVGARYGVAAITGQMHGMVEDSQLAASRAYGAVDKLEVISTMDMGWSSQGYVALPFIATLLLGYSVVGLELVMAMFSSVFVAQVYVFLATQVRQRTAMLVAAWLAFGAEYVVFGIALQKDALVGIGLFYILEMATCHRSFGRDFGSLLLTSLFMGVIRPYLVALYAILFSYYRFRDWASAQWHRMIDWGTSLGLFAAFGVVALSQPASINSGGALFSYPVGVWIDLLIIPALKWAFTPELYERPMDMSFIPLMVIWPFISGGLLLGALCLKRTRFTHPLLVTLFIYTCAISVRYPSSIVTARWRLAVEPLLLALAIEGIEGARRGSLRTRRTTMLLFITWSLALLVLNLLAGAR